MLIFLTQIIKFLFGGVVAAVPFVDAKELVTDKVTFRIRSCQALSKISQSLATTVLVEGDRNF